MYLQELKKRTNRFLDEEWLFITEYVDYKRELYKYRFEYYNFFNWWGLFIWTVAFYFNYSLLRFAIYSVSLAFRCIFLPLRVAVELYIPYPWLRKLLFFFFSFFETVGGIVWLREKFLALYDNFLDRMYLRWEARKAAILRTWEDDNHNPIVRTFDALVRADAWIDRTELRIRRWLYHRLFRYWIRRQIPALYRRIRRFFSLRLRYLRFRSRRFRKWRLRREYGKYLANGVRTGFLGEKAAHFWASSALQLRWGGRVVLLIGRFLWKLCTLFFSKTALVGRSLRYPREDRDERFRISRYYPRPISRSSFGPKTDEPDIPKPAAPKTKSQTEGEAPICGPMTQAQAAAASAKLAAEVLAKADAGSRRDLRRGFAYKVKKFLWGRDL